ncbi:hypothetical protein IMZ48_05410, partial [Candidatus Bathyarchaeota archaeon]|nr:hypothetical protein [Candidatus Bathyarchaeota archaeon]
MISKRYVERHKPERINFEFGRPTRVETDASQVGVGGVLTQLIDGQWHPVAFWSRKLTE